MGNGLKGFLDYLKLGDDDDYDEYLEDFEEKERAKEERVKIEQRKAQKEESKLSRRSQRQVTEEKTFEEPVTESFKERSARSERSSKVVPIRKTAMGLEVCIMKPVAFSDAQDICDVLLNGRAAVVNLEGFDPNEAQRIMDFVSGAVYAVNGKLHQISKYIFIFSPESIDISGDYLDLVPEEGFGVPTINKNF